MNIVEKALFIKKISLFKSLDLDILLAIADKLDAVVIEKEDSIYHPSEIANRMYFIYSGSIELNSGSKKLLKSLKKFDFFGQEELFNDEKRNHFAFAKESCQLLALSKSHLYTILNELPKVAISFLHYLSKKPTRISKGET